MNIRSTPLDQLDLTVVVDNETDNLSSIDAGLPQLPEVASLLTRIPPTRQHDGHDCIAVFDHLCVACHGFSVLVTGVVGNERHTVLFDVGPYGDVWIANAERLGIDLSLIEAVFLSHWHWDHSGGFPVVIGAIAAARQAAGLDRPGRDRPPSRSSGPTRCPHTVGDRRHAAAGTEPGLVRRRRRHDRAPRRAPPVRWWVLPGQRGDRPHDGLRTGPRWPSHVPRRRRRARPPDHGRAVRRRGGPRPGRDGALRVLGTRESSTPASGPARTTRTSTSTWCSAGFTSPVR